MEIFYVLTKYVQIGLLQNCHMRVGLILLYQNVHKTRAKGDTTSTAVFIKGGDLTEDFD